MSEVEVEGVPWYGIINYPSELKTSILAHIIKITVCYGRAELGLSIKISLTYLSK